MKRYRPQPGDGPETVRQKWDSLRNRYEIAKRRAGQGYTPSADPAAGRSHPIAATRSDPPGQRQSTAISVPTMDEARG